MNPYTQACCPNQRLSKPTLLAMLNSQLDTTKIIVVSSGEIIDVSQKSQIEIISHINNGSWVYFELSQPRRMLLTNPNWRVIAFNPRTRMACIQILASSGMRVINYTLSELSPKF